MSPLDVMNRLHLRPLCLAMLVGLAAGSCAPREIALPDSRFDAAAFVPSSTTPEDFYHMYTAHSEPLQALHGRASVQVSEPGNTERLTATFYSSRNQSLLSLRNNLGIEGGRIYSDSDSVLVYNRLERTAHKLSYNDAARILLHGVPALNLIRILQPILHAAQIEDILESDQHWLILTRSGSRHLFNRTTLALVQSEIPDLFHEGYSRFHFENHRETQNQLLPGRIRILSPDEKAHIFFVIRSLEINPAGLDFEVDIPDDIEVIRL